MVEKRKLCPELVKQLLKIFFFLGILWEGHRNLKKISHFVWNYLKLSNNVKTNRRFFFKFLWLSQNIRTLQHFVKSHSAIKDYHDNQGWNYILTLTSEQKFNKTIRASIELQFWTYSFSCDCTNKIHLILWSGILY